MSISIKDLNGLQTIDNSNNLNCSIDKLNTNSLMPSLVYPNIIQINTNTNQSQTKSHNSKVVDNIHLKQNRCTDCQKSLLLNRSEFNLVLNKSTLYKGSTMSKHIRTYSDNNHHHTPQPITFPKTRSVYKDKDIDNEVCSDKGKVSLNMYYSTNNIMQKNKSMIEPQIGNCLVESFEIPKEKKIMKTEHSQIEILGIYPMSCIQTTNCTNDKQRLLSDVNEQFTLSNNDIEDHRLLTQQNQPNNLKAKNKTHLNIQSNIINNDNDLCNDNGNNNSLDKQMYIWKPINNVHSQKNKIDISSDSLEKNQKQKSLYQYKSEEVNGLSIQPTNNVSILQDDKQLTLANLGYYFKYHQQQQKAKPSGHCNNNVLTNKKNCSSNYITTEANVYSNKYQHYLSKITSNNKESSPLLFNHQPIVSFNKGNKCNHYLKQYYFVDYNSWICPPNYFKKNIKGKS